MTMQMQMAAQAGARRMNRFMTQITATKGDAAYNTEDKIGALVEAAAAGTWTLIFQLTVPAQRIYRFGSGTPAYPTNQGYLSFGAAGDGANEWREGTIRLLAANAADTERVIVREFHTARLHGQTNGAGSSPVSAFPIDKQSLTPLPEIETDIVEDSLIKIEFNPDGAAVGAGKTNFIIPVTIFQ